MRQDEDKKNKAHLSREEKRQLLIDRELSDVSLMCSCMVINIYLCMENSLTRVPALYICLFVFTVFAASEKNASGRFQLLPYYCSTSSPTSKEICIR